MPEIGFILGDGIHELVRQAYWFEERQQWALDILECLRGITHEQKMTILNGDAKLVPNADGSQLQMVIEEDLDFKKKLEEHKQYLREHYVVVEGKKVDRAMVNEYVNFVVRQYRLTLRCPQMFMSNPMLVFKMDSIRQALHARLLESVGFVEREGREYLKFAVAIDKLVDEAEKNRGMAPVTYTIYELEEMLEKKYPLIMHPPKNDEQES